MSFEILEDILWECVLEFNGIRNHLPLNEFYYNSSYQYSIGMTLYEALQCRP